MPRTETINMTNAQLAIYVETLAKSSEELIQAVKDLTVQMSEVAVQHATLSERRVQDRRDIDRAWSKIEVIDEKIDGSNARIKNIEDGRLREEQGRTFMHKYWPWIMIIVVGLGVVIPYWARSSVSDIYQNSKAQPVLLENRPQPKLQPLSDHRQK